MFNNKRLLKLVAPFIIIFVITLLIAGYEFLSSKNVSTAEAQNPPVTVEVSNIEQPQRTNTNWSWNVFMLKDNEDRQPVYLNYDIYWCLTQVSQEECHKDQPDYFSSLGSGSLTAQTRNSIQSIKHQSVNCGNVDFVVSYDGAEIAREHIATGVVCNEDLVQSAGFENASVAGDIIDFILDILMALFTDGESDSDSTPDPSQPSDPVNPGDPRQVCSSAGQRCEDTYRIECEINGERGVKWCFKFGSCSEPGDGTKCSWGPGSFCQDDSECNTDPNPSDPPPIVEPPSQPAPEPPGSETPQPPSRFTGDITLSCPIQNNTFIGTKWTWLSGRGHCNDRYFREVSNAAANCRYPGTSYAIDVDGNQNDNLLLPLVNGETVTWQTHGESRGEAFANQVIKQFSTSYRGQSIWLQMHHTKPGQNPRPGTNAQSNTSAGRMCLGDGCGHVHLQVGTSKGSWSESTKHFSCPGV